MFDCSLGVEPFFLQFYIAKPADSAVIKVKSNLILFYFSWFRCEACVSEQNQEPKYLFEWYINICFGVTCPELTWNGTSKGKKKLLTSIYNDVNVI